MKDERMAIVFGMQTFEKTCTILLTLLSDACMLLLIEQERASCINPAK